MTSGQTSQPAVADGVNLALEDLLAMGRLPAVPSRVTARARQAGGYLARQKGRGMEFDEARPYVPGDDVRSLDWKVTARTGHAHTKLFREERERPVFVAVDLRPAMFFATRGVFKSVQAARLAALLAWQAQQRGDRLGGQIVSAEGVWEMKPQHGRTNVLHWLQQLVETHQTAAQWSSPAAAAADAALNPALARLARHARPGSLVYVLGDFRGLDALGEAALGRLSGHCTVVLVWISDPFEQQPPSGAALRLSDGLREALLRPGAAAAQRQRFEQRRTHLQTLARRHNWRLLECQTNADPWNLLRHRML